MKQIEKNTKININLSKKELRTVAFNAPTNI